MELENEAKLVFLQENEKKKDINENGQRQEDRKNIYCNKWLCVFVCIDVVLFTFIIITVCYMLSEKQRDISTDTDICVYCKDITIHPDDDIEGILRKGKNNEICCFENRKTLDVLVGYFVNHWLKENLAKEDRHFTRYKCKTDSESGKRKTAIKLVGRNKKQTGGNDTVLWDGWSDNAILPDSRDIVYDEQHGFIEINKAGLYQIYTQVVLNHNRITHKLEGKDIQYLHQHFVIRTEAGRKQEENILKSSNSYCSCKADNQTVTSYLGGAFYFSKGDRLAVKVHEKAEIVPIDHMNFFGAYML